MPIGWELGVGAGRQLIPLARFSNKFQMKSGRLLRNIIFGDSQTRSVPIHCASSCITSLPEAQSDAFSPAHRPLLEGCQLRGGPQGLDSRVPWGGWAWWDPQGPLRGRVPQPSSCKFKGKAEPAACRLSRRGHSMRLTSHPPFWAPLLAAWG